MTKNEAYEAMQEGYPISHKDFGPDQYLYMDQEFFIRDEEGNLFEASWDNCNTDRWNIDWFIYKGKISKRISVGINRKRNIEIEAKDLVSHIQGRPCPGKNRCLQYTNIAGETACLVCDCNDKDRLISNETDVQKIYIESQSRLQYVDSDPTDIIDKKISLKNIFDLFDIIIFSIAVVSAIILFVLLPTELIVVPSVLFVIYLVLHIVLIAKKISKIINGDG